MGYTSGSSRRKPSRSSSRRSSSKSSGRSSRRSSSRSSGKRSKRSSKSSRSNKEYRNIGTIYRDEENPDNLFISTYDGHGTLVFLDKKTGKAFKPKYISLYEPKPFGDKEPPENAEWNLVLNLKSQSVEEIDLEDLDVEEDDDEDYDD